MVGKGGYGCKSKLSRARSEARRLPWDHSRRRRLEGDDDDLDFRTGAACATWPFWPSPAAAAATTRRSSAEPNSASSSATNDAEANGTFNWKGVPFAKAPVGDLRWKAPVDPDRLVDPARCEGVRQRLRADGPALRPRREQPVRRDHRQPRSARRVGSEDCLYLNVWQPARSGGPRPVVVFVHGGSNISGYTADPVYDGATLAVTANVVVVTVNYRLGIFGFLNQAKLKTGARRRRRLGQLRACSTSSRRCSSSGATSPRFGGDPERVTLMGQSAGAVNLYAVLTSPLVSSANPPLFHRLVPISGGLSLASELPPGSFPTLLPASAYQVQGDLLLLNMLVADGTRGRHRRGAGLHRQPDRRADRRLPALEDAERAADDGADAARADRRRGLGADPRRHRAAGRPGRRDPRRPLPEGAGAGRQHARRRQAVPDASSPSPALGGVSGRLLTDAQVFATGLQLRPERGRRRRRSSSGSRPSTCRRTRRSPASPPAPSF